MALGLPSGTVTLVLGDVEASTERWESSAADMAAAMKSFNATVDGLVAEHGGARPREQSEGDSFVAAFGRAGDAVRFAVALQGASPLPIRIGIHTGDVDIVDRGYAGSTIIRAARLRDAGHGGQVLLSQATAALVADDVELDDLGEHRLKGLTRAERVFQLPGDFPPLRLDEGDAALPPRLTTFVGRSLELTQVRDLLKERGCVTLTGAGGAGKTRLALEIVAERLAAKRASWFVDLATVDADSAVDTAVADAVGAHVRADRKVVDAIAAVVRDKDGILVLDNCEHVLSACSALAADLLGRGHALTVLATSREPLGLAGEVTYRLPSLAESEATELFVERAGRSDPRFVLDAASAAAVAEICARLDGMPLAIELAAARVRVFNPRQLLDALHDRFRLLTGGARTAMPRQRTLEASVDWSYALLLDAERALLRRLSVFAGGFTVDAAIAVAADDVLEPHHVLDLLVQLVEKSLVAADDRVAGRFRMLETIRHYAAARLVDSGEAEVCRRRHYQFFCDVVRSGGEGEEEWRGSVELDEANVRRALQWAADQPGYLELFTLADRLVWHWRATRRSAEGAAWLGQLHARTLDAPADVRARVLCSFAAIQESLGDWLNSGEMAREGIALARTTGNDRLLLRCIIHAHTAIANAFAVDDDLLAEAYAIAVDVHDEKAQSLVIGHRGFHALREGGDHARGTEMLTEALRLAERNDLGRWTAVVQAWLTIGDCVLATPSVSDIERASDALRRRDEVVVLTNLLAIGVGFRVAVGDDAGADRDLAELDVLAGEVKTGFTVLHARLGHGLADLFRGNFEAAAKDLGVLAALPGADGFLTVMMAFAAIADAGRGHHEDAAQLVARALATGFELGGIVPMAAAITRAESALQRGDGNGAFDVLLPTMSTYGRNITMLTALAVAMLGRCCAALGRYEEAARILTCARYSGATDEFPTPAPHLWRQLLTPAEEQCRAALGDERYAALAAEGRAMTPEQAVALVQRGRGSRQRPMLGWDSLTPTEGDVAALVAQGKSNKEVAAQLFMSEATVKTHLTRIYAKVGVRSRTELAHRYDV